MALNESSMCFGCSQNNSCGLKLKFREDGDRIFTSYVAREEHEGYKGILHGGITASILDEIMGSFLQTQGIYAVTAELKVSYHLPVRTGDHLECFAEMVRREGRKIYLRAVAKLLDGTIAATGEAVYVQMI